jgi:hypothetical protein
MILFIETWFLWWMLAIVVVLRWFHLLSAGTQMEGLDALAPEEEEEAYILAWRILHKTQVISLFKTKRAI